MYHGEHQSSVLFGILFLIKKRIKIDNLVFSFFPFIPSQLTQNLKQYGIKTSANYMRWYFYINVLQCWL